MKQTSTDYDVVIIGGGLAGLCSAINISKFGKKVLLIEKTPIQNTKFVANIFPTKFYPIYLF